MRRLLLLAMLMVGSTAWAAPTFATCESENSGSGVTSNSCTIGSMGANHIVILFTDHSSAVTQTLSDTNSWFTWTNLVSTSFTDGGISRVLDMWCGYTASHTGSDTFKATYSVSATFSQIQVAEETDVTFTSCAAAFDNTGTGAGIGSAFGTN